MDKVDYLITDAGHGGMIDGVYQIIEKGSKQYHYDDGFSVYEGVINRAIENKLHALCEKNNMLYTSITKDSQEDIPLSKRVERLVELKNEKWLGSGILISIHNNAGGGTGTEVFTTTKNNNSDDIADEYVKQHLEEFGDEIRMRGHKETNYYIIRKSPFFGILTEGLFMDTRKDAELMVKEEYQERFAKVLFETAKKFVKIN